MAIRHQSVEALGHTGVTYRAGRSGRLNLRVLDGRPNQMALEATELRPAACRLRPHYCR